MATRASKKTKKKATKKKTKTVAKKKKVAVKKKATAAKPKTTTKPKAQTLGNSNKIELLLTENNSLLRGVISAIANLNGGVTEQPVKNDPLNLVNAPATPATPTISKDQITEALQKVAATIGLDGVGELLKKFNAARVSDIQEKDYPAFVKACNDSTAQQGATANPQNPVMDMGAGSAPASANFL